MEILYSVLRVAGLGLAFGAGIPIFFALGMRCLTGDAIRDAEGNIVGNRPAPAPMRLLGWTVYAVIACIVLLAIAWIARDTLHHYLGWDPFAGLA